MAVCRNFLEISQAGHKSLLSTHLALNFGSCNVTANKCEDLGHLAVKMTRT